MRYMGALKNASAERVNQLVERRSDQKQIMQRFVAPSR